MEGLMIEAIIKTTLGVLFFLLWPVLMYLIGGGIDRYSKKTTTAQARPDKGR
jgi:hypothetical protein